MVKPIPEGYASLTPYLVLDNAAKAIEFYKEAFGATEKMRMQSDNKVNHAELMIGNSIIMMSDSCEEAWKTPGKLGGSPVMIMLYVTDVDKTFSAALANGAKEIKPVADQFYGDRSGILTDPFGHSWCIATHVEDVSEEEMKKRMDAMMKQHAA